MPDYPKNAPESHPWRTSFSLKSKDKYAHPNSTWARSRGNPKLRGMILRGMKEADDDLAAMNHWAERGFTGG